MSLAAAILLTAATAQPAAPDAVEAPAQADVIQTRAIAESRMAVDVRLGESGPFRFLVDTGAQNTVLGTRLAERLALKPGREVKVTSIAGKVTVPTVIIDELILGKRSYYGLLAPLLDERHIEADGIVGVDGLQGQRVLIDFRRNIIAIGEPARRGEDRDYEIVVTARRKSGQLIMTDARIEGVKVSVIVDTGADVTVGNIALQTALGKRGAALMPTVLYSVTGQTAPAMLARVQRLEMGGLRIGNFYVAFLDAPPFRALGLANKPAVLLGMSELRAFPRMVIDFPAQRVLFDLPEGVPEAAF